MPNITAEEQAIYDLVNTSFGADPKKMTDLQVKILADLQTEFATSPERSTPQAIHDLVQKDIEAEPVKKKGFFGGLKDRAKNVGNQIANQTVHVTTTVAGETIRQDVRPQDVKNALPTSIPAIDPNNLQTLADSIKNAADAIYKAADAKAVSSSKTLESMILNAAGPDKVLTPIQLQALVRDKDFTNLVKAVGGTLEVDVINAPKHDNDEIVIGGVKHINLGTLLGDQGVTISDDAKPGSSTGFKSGPTVIQNAKGGR